jgi:hypothetical protein
MAKVSISESHQITLSGILNLATMSMEFEELGSKNLKDLLGKFDEESVTLTVKLKNDITD